MYGVRQITSPKLLADVRFYHSFRFPSAVQVFKSAAGEARLRVIPKDEIAVEERAVLPEVPRLPNPEIAKQVFGRIGFKRNRHQGIEQFLGLTEVAFVPREIQKSKLRKLSEQGQVRFEMVDEFGQVRFGPP